MLVWLSYTNRRKNVAKSGLWGDPARELSPIKGCLSARGREPTVTRTPPYFARTPPLNPNLGFLHLALKTIEAGKYGGKHTFLMQIPCFSHRSLESFANLKHLFRMLKIYVENTHNHLVTSGKHSSWPSEHLLHVLLVHLADRPHERLIDYLVSPLMVVHSSAQTQMAHAV